MASLTISHAKSNTIPDWSGAITVANSTGGTTTAQASDLIRPSDWNSNHVATISFFNSDLGNVLSCNFYEELPPLNSTSAAPVVGSWYFQPAYLQRQLDPGQINVMVNNAAAFQHGTTVSGGTAGTLSRYYTLEHDMAIYTRGTGASTSRLELWQAIDNDIYATWAIGISSAYTGTMRADATITLSFPNQWDGNGGKTYASFTTSGSTSGTTTSIASSALNNAVSRGAAYVTGGRMAPFAMSNTLQPGNVWIAQMYSTLSSTSGTTSGIGTQGTGFGVMSVIGMVEANFVSYKLQGTTASNAATNAVAFHGALATTTSEATSVVADVNLNYSNASHFYWNFMAYSTS